METPMIIMNGAGCGRTVEEGGGGGDVDRLGDAHR